MIRALFATCVVLATLCALQWSTLRRLKADIAIVDYSAAVRDFDSRREEIARVVAWLDADARAGSGQKLEPVCRDASPSVTALQDTLLDVYVYLRSRAAGVPETEARQRIADSRDRRGQAR